KSRYGPRGVRILHHDLRDAVREARQQEAILSQEVRIRGVPWMQVAHATDLRLQQLLRAAEARLHRRIEHGAGDRDAEARGSDERVLLGVNADADVVTGGRPVPVAIRAPLAATVEAVDHTGRRAVVAGRDDAIVENQDRADAVAEAVRAGTHGHGNAHVVLRPGRPPPLLTHCGVSLLSNRTGRAAPRGARSACRWNRTAP